MLFLIAGYQTSMTKFFISSRCPVCTIVKMSSVTLSVRTCFCRADSMAPSQCRPSTARYCAARTDTCAGVGPLTTARQVVECARGDAGWSYSVRQNRHAATQQSLLPLIFYHPIRAPGFIRTFRTPTRGTYSVRSAACKERCASRE